MPHITNHATYNIILCHATFVICLATYICVYKNHSFDTFGAPYTLHWYAVNSIKNTRLHTVQQDKAI